MSNRRRESREKGGFEAKPDDALTVKEPVAELKVPTYQGRCSFKLIGGAR